MSYNISADELRAKLTTRIDELTAEIEALEAVNINTTHKVLTQRAVTNGRIADYLSIGKALYYNTNVNGRYHSYDIIAYSYYGEDGQELGANGCIRISRTITPTELRALVDSVIEARKATVETLRADYRRAASIIKRYDNATAQVEAIFNSVTYATRAVLENRR